MGVSSVGAPSSTQTLAARLRRIRNMTKYLEKIIPDVPDPTLPKPSSQPEPGVGTFLNQSV